MQEPNSAEFLMWELKENQRTKREWDAWIESGSDPVAAEKLVDEQGLRITKARSSMKNGGLAHVEERMSLAQHLALRARSDEMLCGGSLGGGMAG